MGGGGVLRLCSKKQTPKKNTKSQRQSGAMLPLAVTPVYPFLLPGVQFHPVLQLLGNMLFLPFHEVRNEHSTVHHARVHGNTGLLYVRVAAV